MGVIEGMSVKDWSFFFGKITLAMDEKGGWQEKNESKERGGYSRDSLG